MKSKASLLLKAFFLLPVAFLAAVYSGKAQSTKLVELEAIIKSNVG